MPLESQSQGQQALEIFFSYAHEDQELRDRLAKHLTTIERQGIISAWYDRQIGAGEEWAGEISEHLERAQIILLLVSADFLASDYCYDIEMKRALERHEAKEARVIPIILKPVDWQGAPFSKLQVLPMNGKAVTSWSNRDEAFLDIAKGIRLVTEEFTDQKEGAVKSESSPEVSPKTNKADWHINIKATLPEIDNIKQIKILEFLKELSGDATLTIKRLEPGSVKIYFEGSIKGFLKIKSLFEFKELGIIHGFKVLEVNINGANEAVPALIEALKDKDEDIRYSAARALGKIGPEAEAAVPALIEALKDKDQMVRSMAVRALKSIGPEAVPALIEALKDKDQMVRSMAVRALESTGPEANPAVPALIGGLKDKDESVRWHAAQTLRKIDPEGKAAVPALIEALKQEDWVVRRSAAEALKEINTPEAQKALKDYKQKSK